MLEWEAAGALLYYLRDTQRGSAAPRLEEPVRQARDTLMRIDASARRNLEIDESFAPSGGQRTLLGVLDRTCSAAGARSFSRTLCRLVSFSK